ncbi:MAG: hypothetical protein ACI906_005205 [Candidatus Latescibacterota bacterium]|jgi:hypothetical protein
MNRPFRIFVMRVDSRARIGNIAQVRGALFIGDRSMADKIFVVFTLLGLVALYGMYCGVYLFSLLPLGVSIYALYSHNRSE